jgi:hypothetical protein
MDDRTNNAVSAVAAFGAGWASYKYLPKIVGRPFGRWIYSELQELPQAENLRCWNAAQKAYQNSGLQKKGVELLDINPTNLEGVTKDTFTKMETKVKDAYGIKIDIKTKPKKPRPKWKYILFGPSGEDKLKSKLKNISEGGNATYNDRSKNVFVNKEKMGFSAFHEMGHAINANSSTARKALSVGRHVSMLFMPLMLAATMLQKRTPESKFEPKSEQRKKNFFKDNIGLITFGFMLPTIVEEGLASINGAAMAKKVLNPKDLKKLNATNAKAWSTYAIGAILASAFAQFAVKIKDKLVEKRE